MCSGLVGAETGTLALMGAAVLVTELGGSQHAPSSFDAVAAGISVRGCALSTKSVDGDQSRPSTLR